MSLGEDPRLILAYVYLGHDKTAKLNELAPVLQTHKQAGTPGLIVLHGPALGVPLMQLAIKNELRAQFAESVLREFGHPDVPKLAHIAETGETLTAREMDVLQLMLEGARNQTIADTLVVSIPTVKTHVSRILAKLRVQSRSEAVARARGLHLL
jgi:ATP/maltotriose-dependent transcriptional regulator MalT